MTIPFQFAATNLPLPSGFTSLDELAQSTAGRVWILRKVLTKLEGGYISLDDSLDILNVGGSCDRIETCQPPHRECYALRFQDGSLYVLSSADDEVWADEQGYLDRYELVERDGAYVGR